ncbi:hypothetical protein RhiJN_28719 [Ceratobasidium sp. AG-Ba]|nr:hypothetical protein RhiJN_28719 [Ceratobasidium sp. AG-Ba]
MAMKSNWRQPGQKVQKSVRFTGSETNRELLEKGTWRKLPPIQETTFALSARGLQGRAVVKFVISKLLFVRLPNARRPELEARCARLIASEQLAAWWQRLPASDQALVVPADGKSTAEMESNFCEAIAEVSQRRGNQAVTDVLSPLVMPILSLWETSGEIANVDDTNEATAIAAKGKKAGNALGEARGRFTREYQKRKYHYEVLRDRDTELVDVLKRGTRFSESCGRVESHQAQEIVLRFITVVRGHEDYDQAILGAATSTQIAVARELAAEQAIANWHICEEFYRKLLEPEQMFLNSSRSQRKRDKTRAGKPQARGGTGQ